MVGIHGVRQLLASWVQADGMTGKRSHHGDSAVIAVIAVIKEGSFVQTHIRSAVETAVEAIRQGHMVIVVDDQQRENEGDLIMAASQVTAESVNFMARFGRGLICVPMTPERLSALELPPMTTHPQDTMRTDFTISVDAREGTTTGISAGDRARTIRVLADPNACPTDLLRPGHVFPLRAREGGVLRRAGHTEAALDLMRLANQPPVAVICEVMKDDGTMARRPDLERFSKEHGLPLLTIADLIQYRVTHETLIMREAEALLPTRHGLFRTVAYTERFGSLTHIALVMGDIGSPSDEPPLVRLHSECLTGDAFGSLRCDCGEQLNGALDAIADAGRGVLLYLRQEGRGIGLANKIKAYALQDRGYDTVSANLALGFAADQRDYAVGAQMLLDLGVERLQLLTNNPDKVAALEDYGLEVARRVPLEMPPHPENAAYLEIKRTAMGHWLTPNPNAPVLSETSPHSLNGGNESQPWPNIKGF
jgi:3,4-dihydroxy 2-butanone 4-phosphate synthase/GTP cyclohydrolase II